MSMSDVDLQVCDIETEGSSLIAVKTYGGYKERTYIGTMQSPELAKQIQSLLIEWAEKRGQP